MLLESNRPLNEQEKDMLREFVSDCRRQFGDLRVVASLTSLIVSAMAFALMLWAGPYLAVLAGIVIGGIITLLVHNSEKRLILAKLHRYEYALDHNQAYVWRIQSHEMIAINGGRCEEALYAFQADENQIVFIDPNYLGDGPNHFPSTDFSIVSILGIDDKAVVNGLVYAQGERLEPIRCMPWNHFYGLRYPDHTEVIQGKLNDLDLLLLK